MSQSDIPLLLDLFCGAGGAAAGYMRAGFDVIGVDNENQPNYPARFIKADALEVLSRRDWLRDLGVVAVHASPPCQAWSDLQKQNKRSYPELIEPTREALKALGLPYVIENVEGAPLIFPKMLCGTMFPGLRVIRHRLFETSFVLAAPTHTRHPLVFTYDKRKSHYGKLDQNTAFVQVTGGGNCTVANKRAAMGIGWMTGAELNEAIPPAYTEHVGAYLMAAVREKVAASTHEVQALSYPLHTYAGVSQSTIVARVVNGPFSLVVLGDSYEAILEAAEAYVEEQMGQRFTPSYYTDLAFAPERGVLAIIEDYR